MFCSLILTTTEWIKQILMIGKERLNGNVLRVAHIVYAYCQML